MSQRTRACTLNPTLPCPALPPSPRALSDSPIIPAAGRLCLKCDTLDEYLLTPSDRIWVKVLSLPHPRPWGHAESLFFTPFWPRGAHTTARPPARTYQNPKFHPNSSMGHPKVPLGRSNFFSSIAIFFCMHPQLGLTAVRPAHPKVFYCVRSIGANAYVLNFADLDWSNHQL